MTNKIKAKIQKLERDNKWILEGYEIDDIEDLDFDCDADDQVDRMEEVTRYYANANFIHFLKELLNE